MNPPTYDECLVDAELRARAAYAGTGRHYHNERHLDDCLARLEAIAGLGEREERLLRWAILWHDSVYEPGRADNEELSAELARRELSACGVGEDDTAEVVRLILRTGSHGAEAGDRLGALLVSIDLAILGSDDQRYREYAQAVRSEFGHLTDSEWRHGRASVLAKLLAASPLYPDPRFRPLEPQARRNMERELSQLREG